MASSPRDTASRSANSLCTERIATNQGAIGWYRGQDRGFEQGCEGLKKDGKDGPFSIFGLRGMHFSPEKMGVGLCPTPTGYGRLIGTLNSC